MREWSMVSMVRSVSGWSDGGLSIVFTAFRISHIVQTILINKEVKNIEGKCIIFCEEMLDRQVN